MTLKKNKYNKQEIQREANLSVERGRITEPLGRFIYDRAVEISGFGFVCETKELRQALVDSAVLRVCEKFLDYYDPKGCAANLVISMIYSTMRNKIKSLNWSDVYGEKRKGWVVVIDENGERKNRLIKYVKNDNLSEEL